MFHVHEEKGAFTAESGFDQNIRVAPFVGGRVTEQFLAEEFEAG